MGKAMAGGAVVSVAMADVGAAQGNAGAVEVAGKVDRHVAQSVAHAMAAGLPPQKNHVVINNLACCVGRNMGFGQPSVEAVHAVAGHAIVEVVPGDEGCNVETDLVGGQRLVGGEVARLPHDRAEVDAVTGGAGCRVVQQADVGGAGKGVSGRPGAGFEKGRSQECKVFLHGIGSNVDGVDAAPHLPPACAPHQEGHQQQAPFIECGHRCHAYDWPTVEGAVLITDADGQSPASACIARSGR
ncbi:hypothetical protein D3C71_1246010 [compost metagenome]